MQTPYRNNPIKDSNSGFLRGATNCQLHALYFRVLLLAFLSFSISCCLFCGCFHFTFLISGSFWTSHLGQEQNQCSVTADHQTPSRSIPNIFLCHRNSPLYYIDKPPLWFFLSAPYPPFLYSVFVPRQLFSFWPQRLFWEHYRKIESIRWRNTTNRPKEMWV